MLVTSVESGEVPTRMNIISQGGTPRDVQFLDMVSASGDADFWQLASGEGSVKTTPLAWAEWKYAGTPYGELLRQQNKTLKLTTPLVEDADVFEITEFVQREAAGDRSLTLMLSTDAPICVIYLGEPSRRQKSGMHLVIDYDIAEQ